MSHLYDLIAIYFLCTLVLSHCGILYGVWAVGGYDVCSSTTLHSRNILVSHSLWKCMRIILVTAYHENLGHENTRSVWFDGRRAFSPQPLSVWSQTSQRVCNAKGLSVSSHHDERTERCCDVRRMRLMMRTNFHLRGGRGVILDDPDHHAEVMRRGNALKGVEDV